MNAQVLKIQDETAREPEFRATVRDLCEAGSNVMIFSRADLSHATDIVKAIKTRTKEIEDERTRLVKPFNEGVKNINARFKAMTAPLSDAEAELKSKMLAFQKDEERRANEEAARLEALRQESIAKQEEQAADPTLDRPIAEPLPVTAEPIASQHRPTTYGQTGAVSTIKKQWAFELTDIQALAAARPDLVQVDTVKINQEIRGKGGEIPGLRIFENEIVQVR